MTKNSFSSQLCHIMENITEFEFRTPDALRLKWEIRQWYYGGRDGGEAEMLLNRFNSLFSGNIALDTAGDLLWSLVDQSPLEPDDSLSGAMSLIPRRQIIGRGIQAYGITAEGIQYKFKEWQTSASGNIDNALDKIGQQLQNENDWRSTNRMSLFSSLISLAGIAALVIGVLFLIPVGLSALLNWSVHDVVARFPSSRKWDAGISMGFLVFFTLATANLLYLLPRMVMTLCAGLFWTLYHRGRYILRRKRMYQFQIAMQTEGLGNYFDKLRTAAQQRGDLPPDAPQNRDPSRDLLGESGMDKVFQMFSLRPISRGWNGRKFYKKVEKCHVRFRVWIVILCVALLCLRGLMLAGSITACLQGLI